MRIEINSHEGYCFAALLESQIIAFFLNLTESSFRTLIYGKRRGKKTYKKPFGEVMLEDFEECAQAGITHPNIAVFKEFITKAAAAKKE